MSNDRGVDRRHSVDLARVEVLPSPKASVGQTPYRPAAIKLYRRQADQTTFFPRKTPQFGRFDNGEPVSL